MKNVLFIPELNGNLLAIGGIEELALKGSLKNGKVTVKRSDDQI